MMARLKVTQPCGCIVAVDYNDMVKIIYCPIHAAAPDMYQALKEAQIHIARNELSKKTEERTPLENKIIKALSKAEGK